MDHVRPMARAGLRGVAPLHIVLMVLLVIGNSLEPLSSASAALCLKVKREKDICEICFFFLRKFNRWEQKPYVAPKRIGLWELSKQNSTRALPINSGITITLFLLTLSSSLCILSFFFPPPEFLCFTESLFFSLSANRHPHFSYHTRLHHIFHNHRHHHLIS